MGLCGQDVKSVDIFYQQREIQRKHRYQSMSGRLKHKERSRKSLRKDRDSFEMFKTIRLHQNLYQQLMMNLFNVTRNHHESKKDVKG